MSGVDQFESFFRRPGKNCTISNLDDRPLQQRGILNDVLDDIARRRFRRESQLLRLSFAFAKNLEWRDPEFRDQFSETRLSKGFVKVVDPFRVDAVFTKQRSQIPARRSGRFFVDGDLVFCHLRCRLTTKSYQLFSEFSSAFEFLEPRSGHLRLAVAFRPRFGDNVTCAASAAHESTAADAAD